MRPLGPTAIALVLAAAPLSAQAWDAPMFLPPTPGDDLGAYYVNPEGGDWGFVGIWRQSGPVDLGARAGIIDADDVGVVLGAEAYDVVLGEDQGLPVDAAWVLGFGGTIGDATLVRVPLGVTVGRAFEGERWTLFPYVLPRVALDILADGDATDAEVTFTTDVGADVVIGERWIVRAGVSLIDRDAIGLGVAYRIPRGVEVGAP